MTNSCTCACQVKQTSKTTAVCLKCGQTVTIIPKQAYRRKVRVSKTRLETEEHKIARAIVAKLMTKYLR